MKRPSIKVMLPICLAASVVTVLVVTGHIPPRRSSNEPALKIIIYTDFQCGACARFSSEIEPELRSRYEATGKAQIEIRLLGAMDPDSMRGAEAALCAREQGKLLEYMDALFSAYGEEEDTAVFSAEALTSLAAQVGLREAAFADCLNNGAKKAQVEENMRMAQADDVHTVPAFLVGNVTIQGRKPLDSYVRAIEEALVAQSQ